MLNNKIIEIEQCPSGRDAFLSVEDMQTHPGADLVQVCRDDRSMARKRALYSFLAPEIEILIFPAWDCLPYDRVGPRRDILSQRLDSLWQLRRKSKKGRIVLTSVNALMQRVPHPDFLEGHGIELKAGDQLSLDDLSARLSALGYQRAEMVAEPGDFALRGGILDLFPAGWEGPLRLDFFGDQLETLKTFEVASQRSTGSVAGLLLLPMSEVILEAEAVGRFRERFRAIFGAKSIDDPLYEAISHGRNFGGQEHWLPLFHADLTDLGAYLDSTAIWVFEAQSEEAAKAREETIRDLYQARLDFMEKSRLGDDIPYRPLEPKALYLDVEEWQHLGAKAKRVHFTPFRRGDSADKRSATLVDAQTRPHLDFSSTRRADPAGYLSSVASDLKARAQVPSQVLIAATSKGALTRLGAMLVEAGLPHCTEVSSANEMKGLPQGAIAGAVLDIDQGFQAPDLLLVTEEDILGERLARPRTRREDHPDALRDTTSLEKGDLVVHVEHGIGRYEGLETLDVHAAAHDCLKLVYHGGDKLYLPVENIDALSKFGSEGFTDLDRLGGSSWQARKARVKQRIRAIANELIKLAAARALKTVDPILTDAGEYTRFAAGFPYAETEDQARAITDVLEDLARGRPMDRLVCGDVGFGKTEVALRAAFTVAMAGRQVAVVVPTTLLARQHAAIFEERMRPFPLRVRQLSRLTPAKSVPGIKAELKDGKVDLVIGTHALLAKDIGFADLGLLIVDEEQHFGVKQKEKLKALKTEVHVLTMTATPIPRTLQLALTGVKELSTITTPPVDRLAVRSFVTPYDPVIVGEALKRELFRGGQAFYVCPRVEQIDQVVERVHRLVPEAKVGIAHGRLSPRQLEEVMMAFTDRRIDILISTNIIESGLDIPNANTMIVHRADLFGLSQLYQLRGRIGRAKQRAYAYFTVQQGRILAVAAERRLTVMQGLEGLGAGFQLASHDLDIRGAGNLLGEEQSGHIREVGIELYQQMLEDAVAAAKAGGGIEGELPESEEAAPQINLGTAVLIPESYVADLGLRLQLYRRLARLVGPEELEAFAAELIDRFGDLPEEVENLLDVMTIKQFCRKAGVSKIDAGPKGALLAFTGHHLEDPKALIAFIQRKAGEVQLRPDHKLVYRSTWPTEKARMEGVKRLLGELAAL